MRRRLEPLGLLALALLLGPGGARRAGTGRERDGGLEPMRGERRIALVIGNGAYAPPIGALGNPANDARGLAAALEQLGFEVTLALDVDVATACAARCPPRPRPDPGTERHLHRLRRRRSTPPLRQRQHRQPVFWRHAW